MGQQKCEGHDARDAEPLGLGPQRHPIQGPGARQMRNVAQPRNLPPGVLGSVHAQHEHQVLVAKRAQLLPLDRHQCRSLEEIADVESDGVKARQNLPLDLQQVAPAGAVKGVFVSGLQVVALGGLRQAETRCVPQLRQRHLDPGQIIATNQQIEVRELAQRDVAIQRLRQHRTFVGQHFQSAGLQMPANIEQLDGQPKSTVRVGLVFPAERFQSRRMSGIHLVGQPAV